MAQFVLFDTTKILFEDDITRLINSLDSDSIVDGKPPVYKMRAPEKIKRFFFRKMSGNKVWRKPESKIPLSTVNSVLIFRYDAIGDYIVTTPLIRWLKQVKPDVRIDVITSFRNDFLIKNDPNVRMTIPVHPAKNFIFNWAGAIRKAGNNKYDIIFGLVFTYMTKCAYFAAKISPRAEKITIMHKDRKDIYGLVFPRQTSHPTWKEAYAETMLKSGHENIDAPISFPEPYIFFGSKDLEPALRLIKREGLDYKVNTANIFLKDINPESLNVDGAFGYCIINISAYSKNRRQQPEKAAETAKLLLESDPKLKVFISGGPDYKEDIEQTVRFCSHERCLPLSLKLNEFIAFCAGASFLISPDTAPVHIAAAAKVPVIGLYAELIKAIEWRPFKTDYAIVLSSDPETINSIEPVKIAEAVSLLQLSGKIRQV